LEEKKAINGARFCNLISARTSEYDWELGEK